MLPRQAGIEFVGKVGSERNINVREAVKNKTVPKLGHGPNLR